MRPRAGGTSPVLRTLSELKRFRVQGTDSELGRVEELFFDDAEWVVRYLVVDAPWLRGRRVLVSPIAVGRPDETRGVIPVLLDRSCLAASPHADSGAEASRAFEVEFHRYYGWPLYWLGGGRWGAFPHAAELLGRRADPAVEVAGNVPREQHIRSTGEAAGCRFEAADGGASGRVEDFVVDDRSWAVIYLVVNTRKGWPSTKKVLLARQWIAEQDWSARRLRTDLPRRIIFDAPAYDPSEPVTPDYEVALFQHYGREARDD